MRARFLFKDRDQRATSRRQMNVFDQTDTSVFVDHGFMRLNHVSSLAAGNVPASANERATSSDCFAAKQLSAMTRKKSGSKLHALHTLRELLQRTLIRDNKLFI